MPTEGKPPSGAGATPPSGSQATSPDLQDADHGWSEPPPAVPDTTPDLAKPPGFPPPPPLPATRVAELHESGKAAEEKPPAAPAPLAAPGSSPRAGSSPRLGSSPRAGSSPQLGSSPRAAATPPSAELPVPAVPAKEPSAPVTSKEPPLAPEPAAAAPAAPPAAALPAPNPALAATAPHLALAPTEPQRAAMPTPAAVPPPLPAAPGFPETPQLPPPIPMSSVKPSAGAPLLVPPIASKAGTARTASEAELRPPGFFARLGATRPSGAWLAIGLLVVLLAFGGGLLTGRSLAPAKAVRAADVTAEKEKKTAARPTPPPEEKAATEPKPAAPAPASKPAEGGGGAKQPFNAKAARTSVDRAAARAKTCRDSRDPAGSISATVTFAPTGKVSDVAITTPRYATTKTGRCVISRLSDARVPEFTGSPVTVKKSIVLR